jgi:hypothetical protein
VSFRDVGVDDDGPVPVARHVARDDRSTHAAQRVVELLELQLGGWLDVGRESMRR